jgi:AcrR family transcriptional regulator
MSRLIATLQLDGDRTRTARTQEAAHAAAIADTAWRLFAERGFDAVPVAEIAREAEVSEATVFNYFATKEDLVFHRMEAFEQELLDALRDRPEGESIVQAFARFELNPRGFLASNDPAATEGMRTVARVMTGPRAPGTRDRRGVRSLTTRPVDYRSNICVISSAP